MNVETVWEKVWTGEGYVGYPFVKSVTCEKCGEEMLSVGTKYRGKILGNLDSCVCQNCIEEKGYAECGLCEGGVFFDTLRGLLKHVKNKHKEVKLHSHIEERFNL